MRRVRDLCSRQVRRGAGVAPYADTADSDDSAGVSAVADSAGGVLTNARRAKRRAPLRAAIDSLDPTDRAIIVRRAFEAEPRARGLLRPASSARSRTS
jgi:hypothetical protein